MNTYIHIFFRFFPKCLPPIIHPPTKNDSQIFFQFGILNHVRLYHRNTQVPQNICFATSSRYLHPNIRWIPRMMFLCSTAWDPALIGRLQAMAVSTVYGRRYLHFHFQRKVLAGRFWLVFQKRAEQAAGSGTSLRSVTWVWWDEEISKMSRGGGSSFMLPLLNLHHQQHQLLGRADSTSWSIR